MTLRDSLSQVMDQISRADAVDPFTDAVNQYKALLLHDCGKAAVSLFRTHGPELMKMLDRHGAGDAEDAARYRWLRDTRTSYGVSAQYDDAGEPTIWLRFSGYGRNAEDTDAAIDAARAGERG